MAVQRTGRLLNLCMEHPLARKHQDPFPRQGVSSATAARLLGKTAA